MRVNTYVLLVGLIGLSAGPSGAQTPKIQKAIEKKLDQAREDEKKKAAAEPETLEQMIKQALNNNPDIRVAELKVREAQASRERARVLVASEVAVMHGNILAAQAAAKEADQRLARVKTLFEKGVLSREELGAAELTSKKWAAEVASLQAKLPYLLGKTELASPLHAVPKLIEEAQKNNPDLRVAETKLLTAEAELERSRIKVAMDVTSLEAEIQEAKAQLKAAEAQLERFQRLLGAKAIPREEYDAGVYALERARSMLSVKQAKLPYLLGKHSAAIDLRIERWLEPAQDWIIAAKLHAKAETSDETFLRRVMLDVQGRLPTVEEMQKFLKMPDKDRREKWVDQFMSAPGGAERLQRQWVETYWKLFFSVDTPMTEKLRKALDAKIRMDVDKMSLKDVLEYLRDKALPDINFHIRAKALKKDAIEIKLSQPVPVGAVLQYLEDEYDIVFVLRDYGIVVVGATDRGPPGATRVIDFWKQGKSIELKWDTKDKVPPAKPKTDVKGMIEKIDPMDASLVQISIGADAGLVKGNTLEVFRTQPEPKYLGRIEIVEVMPTKSVARIAGKLSFGGLQIGDQVTPRLQ